MFQKSARGSQNFWEYGGLAGNLDWPPNNQITDKQQVLDQHGLQSTLKILYSNSNIENFAKVIYFNYVSRNFQKIIT